jgi:hypothetical protein
MESAIVEEFARGVLTDNALLAHAAALGEALTPGEMIELSAAARALYNTAILAGRELERIRECHKLWQAATEVFEQMSEAWRDVDGDDYARAHVTLLVRLHSLSQDRASLYNVSSAERASFARRKAMPAKQASEGESNTASRTEQSERVSLIGFTPAQ